jgi:hypothetical protein
MKYIILLLLGLTTILNAQCPIDARVTKTAMRNGNNSMSGSVVGWAASGMWWEWQVEVTGEMKFTPQGGSTTSLASGQQFGWLNGTGSSNGVRWSTAQDLEPRGNGDYWTEGSGIFVAPYCGAGGSIPTASSPTQNIKRPEHPIYTQPDLYLSYQNGSSDNYGVTDAAFRLTNSVQLTEGNKNGATGIPSWTDIQSGSGGYVSLSPSGSTANMTALKSSDGCLVYNVQIKTSYGGFYSEPLYVAIERPYKLVKPIGLPDEIHQAGASGYYVKIYYLAEGPCSSFGFLNGHLNQLV